MLSNPSDYYFIIDTVLQLSCFFKPKTPRPATKSATPVANNDSLEPVFGNSFLGSDVVDVVSGLVSSVVLPEEVSSLDLPGVVSTVVVVVVDSSVVVVVVVAVDSSVVVVVVEVVFGSSVVVVV